MPLSIEKPEGFQPNSRDAKSGAISPDKQKREHDYNWHLFNSPKNLKKLELVEKLSSEPGITGNQLVLAWMLRQKPQIIPILGFSRKGQYHENTAVLGIKLSDEHLALLNDID